MSTELPWTEVCGSDAGYQRHRYWRSVPCAACTEAHRVYEKRRRGRKVAPVRQLVPCGTSSAYRRHLRRGEVACEACLVAHRAEVARYSRSRKRRAA